MSYSSDEIAAHKAAICEGIASGKSLRKLCDAEGMPSRETVRVWLIEDGEFSGQYARAREEQADYFADEIIDIADTEPDAAKARNRIAARQWKASKLQPKKYGDKIDVNHSGSIDRLSDEQLESRIAVLLGKAGAERAIGGGGEADAEA